MAPDIERVRDGGCQTGGRPLVVRIDEHNRDDGGLQADVVEFLVGQERTRVTIDARTAARRVVRTPITRRFARASIARNGRRHRGKSRSYAPIAFPALTTTPRHQVLICSGKRIELRAIGRDAMLRPLQAAALVASSAPPAPAMGACSGRGRTTGCIRTTGQRHRRKQQCALGAARENLGP